MRFVWAVVAFVLAALMIGAGVAQRTIFQAPEAESASVSTGSDLPYVLIDGAVLSRQPGSQTLQAGGADGGTIFAAYGRSADVEAWLSDTSYTHVSLDAAGTIITAVAEPEAPASPSPSPTDSAASAPPAPEPTATETPAPESTSAESTSAESTGTESDGAAAGASRDPVGSDLWLDEFQQEGELSTPLQLPPTMSVLLATDGQAPAPGEITMTWPVERSTPWSTPLIVAGGIVLLLGVILYLLGIRHVRRSRGPRRKGLPVPVTEPIDLAVEQGEKGVISAGAPGRRALAGRRRRMLTAPVAALSLTALAGCTALSQPVVSASPSPSSSVIVPESQQEPAVSEGQAARILTRVSEVVAEADGAADAALAATRLSGPALAERETNYTLRAALPERPAPSPIPDQPVEIVLPQAFDAWPRSFLSVVEGAEGTDAAPTIMLLTQQDPWTDYKASSVAALEASTTLPDLAAPYVGAVLAPPDSPFLLMRPDELADAYADVVDNGENSAYWSTFDNGTDQLRTSIITDREQRSAELQETGNGTAELVFDATAGPEQPLALTTLDGGAIVSVTMRENDAVRATNADAVIRLGNNEVVRALTGVEESAKGFSTVFVDQLFFYVPLQGSAERIRLLGYRTSILEARENE